MDFVFVKEPHVGTKTKISGINLSEIYNEGFKKIVEKELGVSPHQFDLVFGGRIMKDDKTPKEYKVISGSTVFALKKFSRGEKLECSHKKTKNVRLPEFTELLRHERMQDLIVGIITDPNLVERLTMEGEEDAAALAHLKKLLRNRHFIGLLRTSTFEMFMNTPELLTIGQQVFDKCITDMQNNGQQIPNSDVQLVKMLEEYLSVDYMEEEEEVEVNTEHIGEAEISQAVVDTLSDGQQPSSLPLPPVSSERQQPHGLFTAEMLTSALQGSNTSSPISDPPTDSAEHSRSPPARFNHDDLRGALEGALRTPNTGNHQHSYHHRRSGYEVSRRGGQSSRREDGYEFRRERQERRERLAPHRRERETPRRPELPPDTTAQMMQTYQAELAELKSMGIQDELLAVQVLQATEGDVNTAAEILLQSQQ